MILLWNAGDNLYMQALGRIQILLHRLRERSLGRGHVLVTKPRVYSVAMTVGGISVYFYLHVTCTSAVTGSYIAYPTTPIQ